MTSYSAKNPIPALGGFNPDYYAETATIAPGSPAAQPSRPSRPQQQPSNPPRPHSSSGAYQQQQNYHPPQTSGYGPTLAPPPQQYYAPPRPSENELLPPKPPRPVSWSGSSNNNGGSSSSGSKPSLSERLHQWGVKAGVPINKITNKLGSEAFWPSTMDQECDKAARILQSFCKDGFYTTAPSPSSSSTALTKRSSTAPSPSPGPKTKPTVLVKIPQSVIASAHGLAIFTTFRTGLHISGAGGSGIVVARLPSGRWSPPSGFLVHTLGAGLMIGLDIYDCVCVLRTPEAVRAFTRPGRLSLGGEIGLVAGPVGAGASVEAALGSDVKPVWSYMKSRGFYAGVQADGTVIIARPDANAGFYGRKVTPEQILRGEVGKGGGGEGVWPAGARRLMEVLKAAEGRGDVDEGIVRQVGGRLTLGDYARGGVGEEDSEEEYERERERRRERRERSERGEGSDRRERSDRGDRRERSDRGDRSDRKERSDRDDRRERSDRGDRRERSDRRDRY